MNSRLCAAGLATLLAVAGAPGARAATIVVDSTSDDTDDSTLCTLRDAVAAATTDAAVDGCAAGSGADVIELPTGTFDVRAQVLFVATEVTIRGTDARTTILSPVGGNALLSVGAAGNVTLEHLTLRNAQTAALEVNGQLRASDCVFDSNPEGATVVRESGDATFDRCTFRDNGNTAGDGGGAAFLFGSATFRSCAFVDNTVAGSGGALLLRSGAEVVVEGSYFARNRATTGAAINFIQPGGSLQVSNSTFFRNLAIGAVSAIRLQNTNGVSTIDHSTFVENVSGGNGTVISEGGAMVTLTNSVFARNAFFDCGGPITGWNNVTEGDCSVMGANNQTTVDPGVGLPGSNGALGTTIPLIPGSPAIGASDCLDAIGALVTVDGAGRPRPASTCSAGAFEVGNATVLVATDPEPPGVNCPSGGYAIRSGVDDDGNGQLAESEVDSID
ncbi:MAG: right-handed parallel beta-helix repeat-containing protein, partial [Myxococcota bacterium]